MILDQVLHYIADNWMSFITMALTITWLILEYKASMWLWPIGIILPVFWIVVSLEKSVYGNAVINSYYFVTSIVGWVMWIKSRKENSEEHNITSISRRNIIISVMISIPIIIVAYELLIYTDSKYPLLDAVATIISFVGMIWLSKQWWQHWLCWIISNILYSITFFLTGDTLSTITFIISTIVAVVGIPKWIRIMKNQNKEINKI